MKNENSLTLLSTDSHDESSAIGVRNAGQHDEEQADAVDAEWYEMPKSGSHACRSTNW